MICVSKNYLGTPKNLIIDDGGELFYWSNDIPLGSLTWGFREFPARIEDIAALFHASVVGFIPKKFIRSYDEIGVPYHKVMWHKALPQGMFKGLLLAFIKNIYEVVTALKDSGYYSTYISQAETLNSLQPARIDCSLLGKYLESETSSTVKSTLSSFDSTTGITLVPKYNMAGTKTGRLTITSGPKILTLPSKYRDIITCSPGNCIVQLDFISIEPRTALYLAGKSIVEHDIYSSISRDVFMGSLDRDTAKVAILCALYGASAHRLKGMLGISNSQQAISKVRDYFGVLQKTSELRNDIKSNGFLQNFFGRPLFFEDANDRKAYSHYVQSTAVDVALTGFGKIVGTFKQKEIAYRSLFFIHDAMILEINKKDLPHISQACYDGVNIEGLGNFPLSMKVLVKNSQ